MKKQNTFILKAFSLRRLIMLVIIFLTLFVSYGYAQRRINKRTQNLQLSNGNRSSFQIRNGTLWAWGSNSSGQLGDGTGTDRFIPTKIGSDNRWISISSTYQYAHAIKSDGTLWSWGYGQLGLGYINSSAPAQVGTDNKWVKVSAGVGYSMAIKSDGTLWGWGYNNSGQLGDGSTTMQTYPKKIGNDTWIDIEVVTSTTGVEFTHGIKSDGTLWGWGANSFGQLGDGSTTDRLSPVQIESDNKWVKMAHDGTSFHGIKSDGTLWACGYNSGLFGNGTTASSSTLVRIGTDNKWVDIDATEHVLALKSDGTLFAWGPNNYGQLGDGTTINLTTATQIGSDNKWVSIACGDAHSSGVKVDGTLHTWGYNSNGQIGDNNNNIDKHSPTSITINVTLDSWQTIASGNYFTLGIKSNGTLWAWGANGSSQLGDGTTTNRNCPIQIGSDNKWIVASGGNLHAHGIKSDGTLWGWGFNSNGQLGDGTTTNRTTPVRIGLDNTWIGVTDGDNFTIAIKSDGTLWAWGLNTGNQLGDGSTTQRTSPVQIELDTKWVNISAGTSHVVALKSDGTLWCWGTNGSGQVGNGTMTNQSSPTKIGPDNNWKQVSAGGSHTLGLKSTGTLWSWGNNTSGQLGDGSSTQRTIPVQVGSDIDWTLVSAYRFKSSEALKVNGTLYAWGDNGYPQLGDGTSTNRNSPVQIASDNTWLSLAPGYAHAIGIKANRIEFCATGINNYGQLGYCGSDLNTYSCFGNPYTPPAPTDASSYNDIHICTGGTASITVTSNCGLNTWYTTSTGGSPIYTGGNYNTPVLTTTTTYYVQANTSCGLSSITRTPITVTVSAVPTVTSTTNGSRINPGTVLLAASSSAGTIDWYSVATGGSVIGTGSPFTTPSIARTTIYYARANNAGCRSLTRTPVTATIKKTLGAGEGHSVFIKSDGTLWACGLNISGQLGMGDTTSRKNFTQIGSNNTWISVACGYKHTIGLRSNGTLWAWGHNEEGQLGDGTNINSTSPVQIGSATNWVSIDAGAFHTLAIKSDGTLWAWGRNIFGSLGDGSTTTRYSPVQVGSASNWSSVSGGLEHTIGIKQNGTLWAWGLNNTGQLGNGTTTSIFDPQQTTPIQIGASSNWAHNVKGSGHNFSAAIKSDGTLWAWGLNANGQLGDGTTTDKLEPTQIGIETNWAIFAIRSLGGSAIKTDGTLWAWGWNTSYGELGDGTTTPRTAPVQIDSDNTWISIASNIEFGLGVKSGSMFCAVGRNLHGQFNTGDNTSTTSYSCSTISGLRLSNDANEKRLDVFPNPSNGSFKITSDIQEEYYIINGFGETVKTIELKLSNNYTTEIHGLTNGLYTIVGKDKTKQQRIVVIK